MVASRRRNNFKWVARRYAFLAFLRGFSFFQVENLPMLFEREESRSRAEMRTTPCYPVFWTSGSTYARGLVE